MRKPYITTDDRALYDSHASQNRRVAIHGHVALENRVARAIDHIAFIVIFETLGTECNTLIQTHMVADDTSLTDNDTRTMVDTEIFSDRSSGMTIYTSLGVSQLGDYSWQHGNAHQM